MALFSHLPSDKILNSPTQWPLSSKGPLSTLLHYGCKIFATFLRCLGRFTNIKPSSATQHHRGHYFRFMFHNPRVVVRG